MSDPVEVRRQVWQSLVSMVQVYAQAAGLHGKTYAVTSNGDSATIQFENASLAIAFNPEKGMGAWHLVREGGFTIDEHGVLRFPQGAKDLDMAAMDWLAHLSQPEHVKL